MKQVFMSLLLLAWVLSTAVVIIELLGEGKLKQYLQEDDKQEGYGPGFVQK